jgi:hypothetical protein
MESGGRCTLHRFASRCSYFNYIPMDGMLKRIGNIVIGVIALVMLLRFFGLF